MIRSGRGTQVAMRSGGESEASMEITDVMTRALAVCTPSTDLASAGRRMNEQCCGALPVVDEDERLVGILTDRDVALAVARSDMKPSDLSVDAVMSAPVHTCRAVGLSCGLLVF